MTKQDSNKTYSAHISKTIPMESTRQWSSRHLVLYRMALLLLSTATHTVVPVSAAKTNEPFYIIAHMANSPYSLDWSVDQGANAIEQDVHFDVSGSPRLFEHGGACECGCFWLYFNPDHICSGALLGKCYGTGANDPVPDHLRHLAILPGVALVIIDSKVDASWGSRLSTAGSKLVAALDQNLFANGYRGKVVISVAKINCFDFLHAAAKAASGSPNKALYYFTFDEEGNNYHDVVAMLSKFTNNRAFGTGNTACLPGDYTSGMSQAVGGVARGESGMSYVWTLDLDTSMQQYIDLGVQGILTNRVKSLRSLAVANGLRIAAPSDSIPVATASLASPSRCDCNYHWGGCSISFPAPSGSACRCRYWLWSCSGSLVGCNSAEPECANPGASAQSCSLGGGDCGGY